MAASGDAEQMDLRNKLQQVLQSELLQDTSALSDLTEKLQLLPERIILLAKVLNITSLLLVHP